MDELYLQVEYAHTKAQLDEALGLCDEWEDERNAALRDLMETRGRETVAREETAALRSALGEKEPWPVADTLEKLADAAEHLLGDHACDAHGYELVQGCAIRARAAASAIRNALVGIGPGAELAAEAARLRKDLAYQHITAGETLGVALAQGEENRQRADKLEAEMLRLRELADTITHYSLPLTQHCAELEDLREACARKVEASGVCDDLELRKLAALIRFVPLSKAKE